MVWFHWGSVWKYSKRKYDLIVFDSYFRRLLAASSFEFLFRPLVPLKKCAFWLIEKAKKLMRL